LGAARETPYGLGGLCGEVFDAEDEFDEGCGDGGGRGGDEGAVEGGEGGEGFLAVGGVYEEGLEDVELWVEKGVCVSYVRVKCK
jgi:hypothetical protein